MSRMDEPKVLQDILTQEECRRIVELLRASDTKLPRQAWYFLQGFSRKKTRFSRDQQRYLSRLYEKISKGERKES